MKRLLIIAIVAFVLYSIICNVAVFKLNEKLDEQEVEQNDYKHLNDSLHLYKDERLKNYLQVTLIQDSIIEANLFTRRLKEKHKKLLEHSSKL